MLAEELLLERSLDHRPCLWYWVLSEWGLVAYCLLIVRCSDFCPVVRALRWVFRDLFDWFWIRSALVQGSLSSPCLVFCLRTG